MQPINVIWDWLNLAATVDQNGNVKAVSEGTTTITVTNEDCGHIASYVVNVIKKIIPIASIE